MKNKTVPGCFLLLCGVFYISGAMAASTSLVFKDEFKGVSVAMPGGSTKRYPDPQSWAFTFWPGIAWPASYGDGTNWLAGNGECQAYLTPFNAYAGKDLVPISLRYDPFSIASDGLHIKASVLTPDQKTAYHIGGFRRFGSGMLLSRFSFTYGTIRVIAKVPSARGSWPAIWLLPASHAWPPEIDIVEAMAWGPHQRQIHSGFHTVPGEEDSYNRWFDTPTDMAEGFHEYGLDWTPDTLTMLLDGKVLWQRPTPASMREPMTLIINLAVGGKWPYNELGILPVDSVTSERLGKGSDAIEADYPAEMIIRSVTVVSPGTL